MGDMAGMQEEVRAGARRLRGVGRRGLLAFVCAGLLLASGAVERVTPAEAAPTPPPATLSRYMQHVDSGRHYDLGCALGTRTRNLAGTQRDLTVLHYFRPVRFADGTYGASLLNGADARTDAIAIAAEEFGHGYWKCTGSDSTSRLVLAVGTSNDGSAVTRSHGQAWARMIGEANAWLSAHGYSRQVQVVGASDMELGFNGPLPTRAWVDGFSSICCPLLYDYGDAAGCRADGRPAGDECGSGSFPSWTAEDVWYISWGASAAWPLPLIYRNDGVMAKQWYGIALYGDDTHGSSMLVRGAVTQYQACRDTGCGSGSTLDNTPAQGWTQLWNALNCVYFPVSQCTTAQADLPYSTDMTWVD